MIDTEGTGLRQLLLSFPDLQIDYRGREIIEYLTEGAICHLIETKPNTANLYSVGAVAAKIRDAAGLSYEQAEIISALEGLDTKGYVDFRNDQHTGFVYKQERYQDLCDRTQATKEKLDVAREEWLQGVRKDHHLDAEQLSRLWEAQEQFVSMLIHKHAAEAAAFLYVSGDEGHSRFYQALGVSLPTIDELVDADLLSIAHEVLPRFFDSLTEARRDYIVVYLQGSFYFHLLNIDPTASELIRARVSDKQLYLDTNVIYRLLGLHGPALAFGPAAVTHVATQLNCKLLVAQETMSEFLRALRYDANRLRRIPLRHEVYRRIIAEQPSDQWAFMRLFYQQFLSGQVSSVDEFERKYSQIEGLLQEWGIEIDEDAQLTDELKNSAEFKEAVAEFSSWLHVDRHERSIEHDVFLLRHIRQLRGDTDPTPAKIEYWFLTQDYRLTRFTAYHATSNHTTPAIMADDWLQITRPFLPRTTEFDGSFVSMLKHPLVYQSAPDVPMEHVLAALERLDRYEALPLEVATAMVADGEFLRRLNRAPTEKEEREIIEIRVGKVVAEFQKENLEFKRTTTALKKEISSVREDMGALQTDYATATQSSAHALRQKDESEKRAGALQDQTDDLKGEVTSLRSQLRWMGFGLFSIIPVTSGAILTWFLRDQPWKNTALVWVWVAVVMAALLGIPLRRRAWIIVGVVIGILGLLITTFNAF